MKPKTIIPPSQNEIPLSYLQSHATTDILEVQGKECKNAKEAKNEMDKINAEKSEALGIAIVQKAKNDSEAITNN